MDGGIIEVTPIEVVLVVLFAYVVWKRFFKQHAPEHHHGHGDEASVLTPLEKHDITIEAPKKCNGVDDPHICLVPCGKVYIFNFNSS